MPHKLHFIKFHSLDAKAKPFHPIPLIIKYDVEKTRLKLVNLLETAVYDLSYHCLALLASIFV